MGGAEMLRLCFRDIDEREEGGTCSAIAGIQCWI